MMHYDQFLIDPKAITNYNCTKSQLELQILFWVCAAGKNAKNASRSLARFLNFWFSHASVIKPNPTAFDIIRYVDHTATLPLQLKEFGIGCYNHKAETMRQLAWSGLNLAKCSVDALEEIKGIGPKTARCFVIHTRPNQLYAGLDTHVLKYLAELGHQVPKSTPTGNSYKRLESIFLSISSKSGMTNSEFDLLIWNVYSGNYEGDIAKTRDFLLSLKINNREMEAHVQKKPRRSRRLSK
jgi:hypothetical protein